MRLKAFFIVAVVALGVSAAFAHLGLVRPRAAIEYADGSFQKDGANGVLHDVVSGKTDNWFAKADITLGNIIGYAHNGQKYDGKYGTEFAMNYDANSRIQSIAIWGWKDTDGDGAATLNDSKVGSRTTKWVKLSELLPSTTATKTYAVTATVTGIPDIGYFTISGNHKEEFPVGESFTVTGGASAGSWAVRSVTEAGGTTKIYPAATIASAVPPLGTISVDVCDGAKGSVVGWKAVNSGDETAEWGDIMQVGAGKGTGITLRQGESWLLLIRVKDVVGNTNLFDTAGGSEQWDDGDTGNGVGSDVPAHKYLDAKGNTPGTTDHRIADRQVVWVYVPQK